MFKGLFTSLACKFLEKEENEKTRKKEDVLKDLDNNFAKVLYVYYFFDFGQQLPFICHKPLKQLIYKQM